VLKPQEIKTQLSLLGLRIQKIREKQGLTKTQLAFEMGTGEKYIRELEKGNINITYKNLLKLAYCLNVNISELIQE
jgi:transcriptional regulator with XRE-family HTH domain